MATKMNVSEDCYNLTCFIKKATTKVVIFLQRILKRIVKTPNYLCL